MKTAVTTPTTPLSGWEIKPELQTEDHLISISDELGRIVALVCTDHPVEATKEEERIAKLVVALPDLVEAANRSIDLLRVTIANEPRECVDSNTRESFRLLSKALKKAGVL